MKKHIIAVAMSLLLVGCMTACTTKRDDWKRAKVMQLPEEKVVFDFYNRTLSGDEPRNETEVSAADQAAAWYEAETGKKAFNPVVIKVEGEAENILVFTDENGQVTTSDGRIL